MSIAQQVGPHLPYLRRYARALTGSQAEGDDRVVATLEALVEDRNLFDRTLPSRVALYKLFNALWTAPALEAQSGAEARLQAITPRSRQAFLLVAMERFEEQEAAAVLGCGVEEVRALIAESGREIAAQVATDVLIIEDEPLIAMDLEATMEQLGHRVVGIARTHTEAVALAKTQKVGLILADIQLADGSSGLEAVAEILGSMQAPVIFITAFPERLLTGRGVEPTFLITKPFQTSLVTALASQALLFQD